MNVALARDTFKTFRGAIQVGALTDDDLLAILDVIRRRVDKITNEEVVDCD